MLPWQWEEKLGLATYLLLDLNLLISEVQQRLAMHQTPPDAKSINETLVHGQAPPLWCELHGDQFRVCFHPRDGKWRIQSRTANPTYWFGGVLEQTAVGIRLSLRFPKYTSVTIEGVIAMALLLILILSVLTRPDLAVASKILGALTLGSFIFFVYLGIDEYADFFRQRKEATVAMMNELFGDAILGAEASVSGSGKRLFRSNSTIDDSKGIHQ